MFVPDVTDISQLLIHGNVAFASRELSMTHAVPTHSQSRQSIPNV